MSKKISTFFVYVSLMSGFILNGYTQSVIGIFSDTVYLLSVFHNSGEEKNIDENYYCAVFLDIQSDIESLLPSAMKEYTIVCPDGLLAQQIDKEINNRFVANTSIGSGMSLYEAGFQYWRLKGGSAPDSDYIKTLSHSELYNYLEYGDMLLGEIIDPLVTGGLMVCFGGDNFSPWDFEYKEVGIYYRLFKLCVDYLLLDDSDGSILAHSYKWAIYPRHGDFDSVQNVRIPLGDIGDPFLSHLKVILKDGKLLIALPYSVVNLTK